MKKQNTNKVQSTKHKVKSTIRIIICIISIHSYISIGYSQNVSITNTGTPSNASALLDLDASPTNNMGLLIPRVTFAQRTGVNFNPLPAAAQGLTVYQTDAGIEGEGYYYNTSTNLVSTWVKLFTNTTGWSLTGNAGTLWNTNFLGTTDNVSLRFRTNNVERMYIDSLTGNVGIGTTSPAGKFHVNNDVVGSDSSFVVLQSGNVGIGTTSPAYLLDVRGTVGFDSQVLQVVSSDTYDMVQRFIQPGGNRVYAGWKDSYDAYGISVSTPGTVYDLIVKNTGNVGIGTTIPAQKLDVAGTAQMIGFKLTTTPSNGYVLTSDVTGVGTWQPAAGGSGWSLTGNTGTNSGANFMGTADNVSLRFRTNNTERMVVDSLGNVGIGTTSPAGKFHVYSNASENTVYLYKGTGTGSVIEIYNGGSAGSASLNIQHNPGSSTALIVNHNSTGNIVDFQDAGTSVFRILDGGNVGIWTSTFTPLTHLDVRGINPKATTAVFENIIQAASGDAASPLTLRMGIKTDAITTSRYGAIEVDDAGTKRALSLQPSGGNVGIGTTSPAYLLDVNGTARILATGASLTLGPNSTNVITYIKTGGYAYHGQNDNGSGSFISAHSFPNSGTTFWATGNSPTIVQAGYDAIDFYGSNGAVANTSFTPISRMHITPTTGNVGIGTTSPTSKLQVVGLPVYADNAAAIAGGLTVGAFYRTGDLLKVVW